MSTCVTRDTLSEQGGINQVSWLTAMTLLTTTSLAAECVLAGRAGARRVSVHTVILIYAQVSTY